jgi:hypothetical protein
MGGSDGERAIADQGDKVRFAGKPVGGSCAGFKGGLCQPMPWHFRKLTSGFALPTGGGFYIESFAKPSTRIWVPFLIGAVRKFTER